MKVFVAGASGAIGPPLVVRLTRAGHEVTGMVSSPTAPVGSGNSAPSRSRSMPSIGRGPGCWSE